MTDKQKEQHNQMRDALKVIATQQPSLAQLRKRADEVYGLSYIEALEQNYRNIIAAAAFSVKGIRIIK